MLQAAATKQRLLWDAVIVAISIAVAVYLAWSGSLEKILLAGFGFNWLESFIAGIFFTSAFTTAPAMVLLGSLAQKGSVLEVAFFGGLGALAGDMIIFQFFRSDVSRDIFALMNRSDRRRVRHIFHLRLFRWITPFIGALIIASPLPDELALAFMGFSRVKPGMVAVFSFVFNSLGILLIALAGKALL